MFSEQVEATAALSQVRKILLYVPVDACCPSCVLTVFNQSFNKLTDCASFMQTVVLIQSREKVLASKKKKEKRVRQGLHNQVWSLLSGAPNHASY